ncbi:hypothetical protein [Knoellia subterranea]|uniref:Uncharacterized protein n=1 Tax=Knoellia subterranea KCTC 19937 TaxID=1385521 RepID=A0A0A0JIU0_9MICO|nr:hypothetical protein [Knoellia subterranea]KGN35551.1 hypothetical protein N803_06465 [Knoellia subterranea KCTC 19937]
MKYLLWLGMLVWPSYAAFDPGADPLAGSLVLFAVLLGLGVLFGRKFPHDVGPIALCGIAGGLAGVAVSIVLGVARSEWGGLPISLATIGASWAVAALIKKFFSPIGVVVRI